MIMRRGQQLLLPAKGWFVFGSLIAALLLNMIQGMGLWGRAAWTPDVLTRQRGIGQFDPNNVATREI